MKACAESSVTRLTQRSTMSTGGEVTPRVGSGLEDARRRPRLRRERAGRMSRYRALMRAALLEASEKPLEIVNDIDIDDPRVGEVMVRVTHCGVCHSDLSMQNGTFPVMSPTVLGHEAAGVVEKVGVGVTSVHPGDKVVLTPVPSCNQCYWCLRGEYGCCVNSASLSTGALLDGHTPLSRHGQPV